MSSAVLTGRGSGSSVLVGGGALRLSLYMEIHFIRERSPSTPEFCQ